MQSNYLSIHILGSNDGLDISIGIVLCFVFILISFSNTLQIKQEVENSPHSFELDAKR